MNSIWIKNISLLQQRFPQLYAMMEAELQAALPADAENLPVAGNLAVTGNLALPCGWILKHAKTGLWTGEAAGGQALHSRYDPHKEGQRLAQTLLQEMASSKKQVPVFMGFGLGYGVVALAQEMLAAQAVSGIKPTMEAGKNPMAGLVLVEPDVACFAAALWSLDFEPVFALEKCALLVGASHQSVLGVLESFGLEECHLIWNKAHTSHNQPYFDGLHTLVQRNLDKDAINNRTLAKFGQLWLRNSCRNLDFLATYDGVKRYENLGWNLDACVVGAGPSLDEILPHLKEIKERCLLIAVDTALRACLRAGVEPDFVVLGDPQYWNARHLAGLSSPSSILITEVAAYPSVFRFPCQEVVLCSSLYPVGKFFSARGLDKGDLGAGGSVATSAWGLARLCGCRRIFLAAVDLAFPGKRTHAHGSTFEEKTHQNSTRLVPSQQSQVAALFSADISVKKSYVGEPVITDQRMELYAWWFESKVAAHPEVQTFSLSPHSLAIPGIQVFPLDELLQEPPSNQERQEFFVHQEKARAKFKEQQQELASRFRHLRSELQAGLFQLYKVARKAVGLCQETLVLQDGPSFEAAYSRIISQLTAIDQVLRSSPCYESAALAFPSQQQMEKLYQQADLSSNLQRGSLEKSRMLYQKIMEALAEYNRFLE
ncbi:MAG: motility associated factor glycosyltransferase family protein [Spirochaetaceae bacterium]|nr:motility associated factor glycosyltransferase family protein [Spirochaetaceae bacterium]